MIEQEMFHNIWKHGYARLQAWQKCEGRKTPKLISILKQKVSEFMGHKVILSISVCECRVETY